METSFDIPKYTMNEKEEKEIRKYRNHFAASDPKSDVSANFTTCAFGGGKSNGFFIKNCNL